MEGPPEQKKAPFTEAPVPGAALKRREATNTSQPKERLPAVKRGSAFNSYGPFRAWPTWLGWRWLKEDLCRR